MAGITDIKIGESPVSTTNPLPISTIVGGAVISTAAPLPTDIRMVGGAAITQGQKAMSASFPVVLASDQSTVVITGSGTAGSAAAGAQTVQGIASMVPMNVSDQTVNITVSVTLTVGATYASGDFVGTSTTPISFANAVRTSGGSATIRAITISDPAASVAAVLELWLFNATVTPPADSAAWALSDADGLKCVAVVSIPTTAQFLSSATGVLHLNNQQIQYHCAATTLFGALVTRGAPTYTGTLQVMLEIEYDQ